MILSPPYGRYEIALCTVPVADVVTLVEPRWSRCAYSLVVEAAPVPEPRTVAISSPPAKMLLEIVDVAPCVVYRREGYVVVPIPDTHFVIRCSELSYEWKMLVGLVELYDHARRLR